MAIEVEVTPESRAAAADKCLKDIEKEFGKGLMFSMKDRVALKVPSIPTGLYSIDYNVIGCGGLPRGRIVEIFGAESGGKTSLTLLSIAQAQRAGGRAAFIDAEHALDPRWASQIGVDMDELMVSQPDYGEQALRVAEVCVESGAFDIVAIDSVSALVPKTELEGEIGDAHVGLQARMMSQALRILTGKVARSGTVLVFINQLRSNIGNTYNPTTTSGGRALRFFASLRLEVTRIGAVKKGEEVIGNKVKIKAAKNKLSPPFRDEEVELLFNRGFDTTGNLIDVAVDSGLLVKSGSWYQADGQKFQGKDALRDYYNAEAERLTSLYERVVAANRKEAA